jgi:hypothetical protein
MINKEDNFNEFLKQKVAESHFEYNEAYWLKAEKLIEEAQPKRKPIWWGFGFGLLSLVIIGGVTAMIYNSNQRQLQTAQRAQTPATLQARNVSNNTPTRSIKDISASNSQSKALSETKLLVEKQTAVASLKAEVSAKKLKSNTSIAVHQGIITENKDVLTNQSDANNQSNYSKMGNFSQVRNLSVPKTPVNSATEEDEDEQVITIAAPIVINARKPVVKDIDVNIVAACENKNTHEWMFNLLAGVSDSRGFEGNTVASSRIGFGYFGGLRLAYKLNKNWFVGVQPLVYSRGAINTSIQTEKTAYDFGANADEFIVKNKALLFAEIPVSIGYRIQRHQISIGAGIEYLANVKSDVKAFGTSEYTPNQWGYTEGFNRFGTIGIFNYAFNVYNEFWLTMMVQKGFTDLTKADYFTNNSEDKNFNIRIGIQYQLNNQKKKGK